MNIQKATAPEEVVMGGTRQEKHVELSEAIQGVGSIIRNLDDLLDSVKGQDSPVDPKDPNKYSPASLLDVLNHGAGNLREQTDLAHQRISELRELLF